MYRFCWASALALALVGPADAGEPVRATLDVPSMNCSLCPIAVAGVLRKQPGVQQASADLASKTARILYDPDQTTPERLAQAVTEAGYPAKPRAP
ncbi:MAG: heavy-metal-associated domain-containing protein [Vicinamibacteria bacterium]